MIESAIVKYNNLVKKKLWNCGESKDAKIVALATKVEELETTLTTTSSNYLSFSSSNNISRSTGKSSNIPDCKMENTGPSIEIDDCTWYWCPHHIWEGYYNGL